MEIIEVADIGHWTTGDPWVLNREMRFDVPPKWPTTPEQKLDEVRVWGWPLFGCWSFDVWSLFSNSLPENNTFCWRLGLLQMCPAGAEAVQKGREDRPSWVRELSSALIAPVKSSKQWAIVSQLFWLMYKWNKQNKHQSIYFHIIHKTSDLPSFLIGNLPLNCLKRKLMEGFPSNMEQVW